MPPALEKEINDFRSEAEKELVKLAEIYGPAGAKLSRVDAVTLMDGWNKVLAFQTMWKEAFFMRWRILLAREKVICSYNHNDTDENNDESNSKASHRFEKVVKLAEKMVDKNQDPIALCLGSRLSSGKDTMLSLFDQTIRDLCPHTQTVQREAYRPTLEDGGAGLGFSLECNTVEEIFRMLSRCGLRPKHVGTALCEAFLWSLESHTPYALDDEKEDLEQRPDQGAFSRFVADKVARMAIKDMINIREDFATPMFTFHLPTFWRQVKAHPKMKNRFGEKFYTNLLTDYPELLDYFARADMDTLSSHIALAIDLMLLRYSEVVAEVDSVFRKTVDHLADMHRRLDIPTDAYPSIGLNAVKTLQPFFTEYVSSFENTQSPVTADELTQGLVASYMEVMWFVFHPMLKEEKLIAKAEAFIGQCAEELRWPQSQLSKRLCQVKLEINKTGTYSHTSDEIQVGARLAWRNSAKCIGRIAWNTLEVRDRTHVNSPSAMMNELIDHFMTATAGTNIQSVMTVFRALTPDESWGPRFWTEQGVRYAAYKDEQTGEILGDVANLEFTEFIVKKGYWTPPEPRTQHDILPCIFKMPGIDTPIVHEFDPKYLYEAQIEHPDYPDVAKLGHKWGTVPILNTMAMNLGGIQYTAFPFNGWFCSIEIVRNLMERYSPEKFAMAMGIDTKSTRMWKNQVQYELDRAICHSFDKSGFTIVDLETVGEQFVTHCKREKANGRECPGQWSWIGGLAGPTNVTWHKEMRDFLVTPQYEYCAQQWKVVGYDEEPPIDFDLRSRNTSSTTSLDTLSLAINSDEDEFDIKIPRVLIAYGSETGTAESAAGRLGRSLRICRPIVCSLNDVAGMDVVTKKAITHVLVLCSTFGSGEAPSNATDFMKTDIPLRLLVGTKVAVLGLGSSMYPDFARAGINVANKLNQAGAVELIPLTKADEAVDSPAVISGWLELTKNLILPESLETQIEASLGFGNEPVEYKLKWSEATEAKEIVPRFSLPTGESICRVNEELIIGNDPARSTRRIVFDVPPDSSYITGDHLSVQPLNSLDMIKRFAMVFEEELTNAAIAAGRDESDGTAKLVTWQLQQTFEVDCLDNGQVYPAQTCFSTPSTLADILQANVTLSLSSASVNDMVMLLKEHTSMMENNAKVADFVGSLDKLIAEGEKHNDGGSMESFLSLYPTLVDLLEAYKRSTKSVDERGVGSVPSIAYVLPILPRLQPRLYSISSSNVSSPRHVEITVGVVHATTDDGVVIKGVCSNYIAGLSPGTDGAHVSIHQSSFRAPRNLESPVILVGAGTGLAPMMGFVQDRAIALKKEGNTDLDGLECHLFFGCRSEEEAIYKQKLDEYERSDVLKLHLALSRSKVQPKMYVQDAVERCGEHLASLLIDENCHYYVCGDARMGDECYEAFVNVLRKFCKMSRIQAVNHLKRMRVEERWQYDLWGVSTAMDESYAASKELTRKKRASRAMNWLNRMNSVNEEEIM